MPDSKHDIPHTALSGSTARIDPVTVADEAHENDAPTPGSDNATTLKFENKCPPGTDVPKAYFISRLDRQEPSV